MYIITREINKILTLLCLNKILKMLLTLFSWHRVYLYKGFLSEEECDHLISLVLETCHPHIFFILFTCLFKLY